MGPILRVKFRSIRVVSVSLSRDRYVFPLYTEICPHGAELIACTLNHLARVSPTPAPSRLLFLK